MRRPSQAVDSPKTRTHVHQDILLLSYTSRNRPPLLPPSLVRPPDACGGIIPMPAHYEPCLVSLSRTRPTHRPRPRAGSHASPPPSPLSTILPASRNCILHIRIQQVFRHITRSSRFPLRALRIHKKPTSIVSLISSLSLLLPPEPRIQSSTRLLYRLLLLLLLCQPPFVLRTPFHTCTAYQSFATSRSLPFLGLVICRYSILSALFVCHPVLILQSTTRLIRSRKFPPR